MLIVQVGVEATALRSSQVNLLLKYPAIARHLINADI
jgi:hypothetical protein